MEIALIVLFAVVVVLSLLLYRNNLVRQKADATLSKESMENMKNEFRVLSQQMLDLQSRQFARRNEEQIDYLLRPFKVHLDMLNRTVLESNAEGIRRKASFDEAMKRLVEQTDSVGRQAENLARALKGENKVQGDWGEMILEAILERSGLVRDREYFLQYNIRMPDGHNLRPDAVVCFPDNKKVVVDSKVSLTSYMDYLDAGDEALRKQAIEMHVRSVRSHVDELAAKAYNSALGDAGSHVLLFLQSDAAYILAVSNDAKLNEEAFRKGIVLTCPTTLMTTLQIIYNIWQSDRQNKNVEQIIKRASSLYDKFVGFVDTFKDIDRRLNQTHEAYEKALKQLCEGRGNLVRQTEELRSMGITSQKQLSEDLQDRAGVGECECIPTKKV